MKNKKHFLKNLLLILLLTLSQTLVSAAQDDTMKTNGAKDENVVPVLKQTGSHRFRCLGKAGVFNYEHELQRQSKGDASCVNPFDLLAVDSEKQTLIGYRVAGDCKVRARAEVFRNDAAKTFRIEIVKKSGKCRAAGEFQGWLVIEKIPKDYKVEFSEANLKENEDFKIELLEETLSLTNDSAELKTRDYEMDNCMGGFGKNLYVIKSQTEFLKSIRDDASRKTCLEKLEKIDFEKEALLGATVYSGYCRYPEGLAHKIMRDDRRKIYTVFITYDDPYGRTCRALGMYDLWLAVPKPPDDYEINFRVASVFIKSFDY